MKLKTLKDIFKRQFECDEYDSGECVSILETELKAEAVKRVKYYQRLMNNKDSSVHHDGKDCLNELCPCFLHGRIMELKDNFNLTEEDLK